MYIVLFLFVAILQNQYPQLQLVPKMPVEMFNKYGKRSHLVANTLNSWAGQVGTNFAPVGSEPGS
jgi:hypothetical protein